MGDKEMPATEADAGAAPVPAPQSKRPRIEETEGEERPAEQPELRYGRRWEQCEGAAAALQLAHGSAAGQWGLLRVATWNVLADSLAQSGDSAQLPEFEDGATMTPGIRRVPGMSYDPDKPCHVLRCPASELQWDRRAERIAAVLNSLHADVVALQEVDSGHYEVLLQSQPDYDGAFVQKTGCQDGVAILWRRRRLRACGRVALRYTGRAQVGALVRLELLHDRQRFVVATCHLKAGMKESLERVRAEQLGALLRHARRLARGAPVVIAGDLNAHPSPLMDVPALALPLATSMGFGSVYPVDAKLTAWSGWVDREVMAAFDHILFTPDGVRPLRRLGLPAVTAIAAAEQRRLPSAEWPSDHLVLACDVTVAPASESDHLADGEEECWVECSRAAPRSATAVPRAPEAAAGAAAAGVCGFFSAGRCRFGQQCRLPHSDGRRMLPCPHYASEAQGTGAYCRFGDRCHFLHSTSPMG